MASAASKTRSSTPGDGGRPRRRGGDASCDSVSRDSPFESDFDTDGSLPKRVFARASRANMPIGEVFSLLMVAILMRLWLGSARSGAAHRAVALQLGRVEGA